jgi:hypothetical protein
VGGISCVLDAETVSRPGKARSPDRSVLVVSRELARTWHTIRQRHPDVPDAVLVVASGAEGKRLNLGQ